MFKKYGIGLLAVILAVASSAFTTISNKPVVDLYVFEYDPGSPADYTELRVEDESNSKWKFVGINAPDCTGLSVKACRVAVTSGYVNSTITPTALNNVTIDATETSTNIARVTSITDPSNNSFTNKP